MNPWFQILQIGVTGVRCDHSILEPGDQLEALDGYHHLHACRICRHNADHTMNAHHLAIHAKNYHKMPSIVWGLQLADALAGGMNSCISFTFSPRSPPVPGCMLKAGLPDGHCHCAYVVTIS